MHILIFLYFFIIPLIIIFVLIENLYLLLF